MSIHTEVVLDLIEKDRYGSAPQIQFRLVEGEFHKLQVRPLNVEFFICKRA